MLSLSSLYPYLFAKKDLFRIIGIFFVASYIFNYLFEPYNVWRPEHKMGYPWICFIHTLLPLGIVCIYFSLLNWATNPPKYWSLRTYLFHFCIIGLMIGIVNFLIRDLIYDNPDNWSLRYFLEEVRNAYLSTFLLSLLIIPIYIHLSRTRNPVLKSPELDNNEKREIVWIETQLKTDNFSLDLHHFLFAQAEGNYVAFILQTEDGFEKKLKRISLKKLEVQLSLYPYLLKTHRAYLINLLKIQEVQGNSRGYQVSLQSYPDKIPVSRSMVPTFDSYFSKGVIADGISTQ